jgi:hypothetical protein
MALDLGQFLTELKNNSPRMGTMIQQIVDAVNQVAQSAGVDATQYAATPSAPNAINVAAGSDHVHVTITDNTARTRAHNYFVEWSANDPNFLAPNVEHLGPGRGRVLALPAKNGAGDVISYYFRTYKATLSGKSASKKVTFGGSIAPTAVTLTGNSTLDLLPSTGAGTSPSNGQRAGNGFGPTFNTRAGA